MPPAVQVGAILIEESPLMTQLLGLESEPYSGSLVKVLDGFALDRKIRASGWNFFFIAAEEKAMFFSAPGAEKIQNLDAVTALAVPIFLRRSRSWKRPKRRTPIAGK